jgi:hypothetical protein
LLDEPEAPRVRVLWRQASRRAASVALIPETRAALAGARRSARIDETRHTAAVGDLERLWRELDAIEVTEKLAHRAGHLADACGLRGYDAIHLASAEAILDEGDVMIVSDTRLAEAAASLGIDALVPAEP